MQGGEAGVIVNAVVAHAGALAKGQRWAGALLTSCMLLLL
jgi:hypothetical protein